MTKNVLVAVSRMLKNCFSTGSSQKYSQTVYWIIDKYILEISEIYEKVATTKDLICHLNNIYVNEIFECCYEVS